MCPSGSALHIFKYGVQRVIFFNVIFADCVLMRARCAHCFKIGMFDTRHTLFYFHTVWKNHQKNRSLCLCREPDNNFGTVIAQTVLCPKQNCARKPLLLARAFLLEIHFVTYGFTVVLYTTFKFSSASRINCNITAALIGLRFSSKRSLPVT